MAQTPVPDTAVKHMEARERVREYEQGKGKPVISAKIAGHRVVAVGNRIYYSKDFKTFVDFLNRYFLDTLGPAWGNSEIAKPLRERHTILQWYDALCAWQKKHFDGQKGEVQISPATGLLRAYYGLAYNLYLLDHNAELQAHLVARLKRADGFHAAYYETFVAAWFILAGFELSIENEQDSTTTHPEFIATKDGVSYSVEAKARRPGKPHLDVGNQLYKALCIDASHARIVFIDLNVGADLNGERFVSEVSNAVRSRESSLTIRGEPAPPAYVIVTNQPYHLHLDNEDIPNACLGLGFKLPDFGHNVRFPSLVAAHKAHKKHAALDDVLRAFRDYRVPSNFDGELAEFAYGGVERRFLIGQRYELRAGHIGTLCTATVLESSKTVHLGFNFPDGTGEIWTAELSDMELEAYRKQPETFFGQVTDQGRSIDTPLDLFEMMLKVYKNTPRDQILQRLSKAPDIEKLKSYSDEDLRMTYVERIVASIESRNPQGP